MTKQERKIGLPFPLFNGERQMGCVCTPHLHVTHSMIEPAIQVLSYLSGLVIAAAY